MFKFCLAVILASLALTLTATSTLASCAPKASVAEYISRADVVVTGKITHIYDSYALLAVDHYYKAAGAATLQVSGRISPQAISSVDLEFKEGSTYLLFLKGGTEGVLRANVCDGSREVTSGLSQEEQTALGQGSTPAAQPVSAQPLNPAYYALAAGLLTGLLLYLLRARQII